MEELKIEFDLGELEEIEKTFGSKFSYPVVHFGRTVVFNREADKAGLVGEAIRWFVATDYIVGLPAKRDSENAFSLKPTKRDCKSKFACFPVALFREKKVAPGYYKLLKYKDGFAFKRYEPIVID
jgi:hypothetical protein